METKRKPHSLRAKLLTTILLCWVLPLMAVVVLAGVLLTGSYERAARQELESGVQNALEQVQLRLHAVFESSKGVSYDGVVRNSYRRYQSDGDSADLYKTVTEYLNQNFNRDELIPAAFISYWEDVDVRPYASSRGDFGYSAQREYREHIERDLLERMESIDTGILLLEYGGELYVARNLLDSHFRPYATVVLLCDRELLFQSFQPVREISEELSLRIDDSLELTPDGLLRSLETAEEAEPGALRWDAEAEGHSLHVEARIPAFHFWRDVPQLQMAGVAVAMLVLPLLLAVILLFRSYVTRPVETLIRASERLEEGERGYVIGETPNSREFQRLYEHFNSMSTEMKNQFERSYREQQALQKARVKALQSQINPHFLNNTLEIINWEARLAENDRVSAMIEALSVMLDAALDRDGRSQIPLREELSYVDAYLYIIRERLGERLEIERRIDSGMEEVMVPRLILQPLVENAVEHDITPRRGGRLCVRAGREGDRVVLEVEHEGTMSPEDRESISAMLSSTEADTEISGQVGLRNVKQRLDLIYGADGELSITQSGDSWILARVRFPERVP